MSRAISSHKLTITAGSGRSRRLSIGKAARVLTPHGLIMISHAPRVHGARGRMGRAASRRSTSSAKEACPGSVSGTGGGVAGTSVKSSIGLTLAPATDVPALTCRRLSG